MNLNDEPTTLEEAEFRAGFCEFRLEDYLNATLRVRHSTKPRLPSRSVCGSVSGMAALNAKVTGGAAVPATLCYCAAWLLVRLI